MSYKTAVLPVLDFVRGRIPGMLGLRTWTVTVRVRTWSGARVGLGTKTDVDTVITNSGGYSPKVTEVSSRDIIASGGALGQAQFRVGPITPEYATGGTAPDTMDPPTTTTAREVLFKLEGTGFPTGGTWCKRIDSSTAKNFQNEITLQETGVKP